MWFDRIERGGLNRAQRTVCRPGGKGINVSRVLWNLGVPSICLGFVAGFVGREIIRALEETSLSQEFIFLKEGCSRINVKVKAQAETELNASGPAIDPEAMEQLRKRIAELRKGDLLVLSGNPPAGTCTAVYAELMRIAAENQVRTVVDASGDFLKNTLEQKPYLIKPNRAELEELEGKRLSGISETAGAARRLLEYGAEHVLVSLGGQGAVLVSEEETWICSVPPGKLVDSTGAGDSMTAAFLTKKLKGCSDAESLRYAVACGSASAYSRELANVANTRQLYEQTPLPERI